MVPSVVPSLEVPGGQMGPRGTAGNDKSLRCSISVAVPPGPMLLPLETPCCCASKPLRRPSKPYVAVPRNPSAAPQNPMLLCLETLGPPRLETPGDKF